MKLKVLSANLLLLFSPLTVDNKKRLHSFVEMCVEYQPDFILLQEVWLNRYIKQLDELLEGYYQISRPRKYFNKGGLVMFSKYKPQSFNLTLFTPAKRAAFYDRFYQKGYLSARFQINKQLLEVVNVHLNCPYRKNHWLAWEKQFSQILAMLRNKSHPLVLGGDFNKENCGIENDHKGQKPMFIDNPYLFRGFHKLTHRLEKHGDDVDKILYYVQKKWQQVSKSHITRPLVSDHYPVFAEIKL